MRDGWQCSGSAKGKQLAVPIRSSPSHEDELPVENKELSSSSFLSREGQCRAENKGIASKFSRINDLD
jgi:hypothetical protein